MALLCLVVNKVSAYEVTLNQSSSKSFSGENGGVTFSITNIGDWKAAANSGLGKNRHCAGYEFKAMSELTWQVPGGASINITEVAISGTATGGATFLAESSIYAKTSVNDKETSKSTYGTNIVTINLGDNYLAKIGNSGKVIIRGENTYYINSLTIKYDLILPGEPLALENLGFENGNFSNWSKAANDEFSIISTEALSGKEGTYFGDLWWWDNSVNCTRTETVPNGKYQVSALGHSDADNNIVLFANDEEVKIEDTNTYSVVVDVTNNTLKFGVKGDHKHANWFAIDDFKVNYLGTGNTEANLKVTQGKYGTFCAPFDVTIPSGIKAYTVSSLDGATLNLSEVTTTIPATTPVVVEGVDNDYDGNFYGPGPDAPTCDGGNLVGILKAGTKVPAGSYLLQTKDGKQGFYKRTAEANGTANRCYLKADAEAKVLSFVQEETSIESVSDFMPEAIQTIYNGNGVKVNNLQKGLNIVKMMNGQVKKIMVK